MKLLLYCTKAKPYLYKTEKPMIEKMFVDYHTQLNEAVLTENLNGKIVAECDFEVEEIFGISRGTNQPDKYDFKWEDRILNGACLTNDQMNDYIPHYAIHIKNLHIFDKPKKLSDYYSQGQVDWIEETELYRLKNGITTAPQNMCYAYKYSYSKEKLEKYILISIQPQWLCKILNGEKTIEVRKKVLKEMLG